MKRIQKQKLWQNVMTIAINELLDKGLISLEYNEENEDDSYDLHEVNLIVEKNNILLDIYVHDIGFGELRIYLKGFSKFDIDDIDKVRTCKDKMFKKILYKDIKNYFNFACYLERKTGKYIMDEDCSNWHNYYVVNNAKLRKQELNDWMEHYANTDVVPNGFQKTGKFYL